MTPENASSGLMSEPTSANNPTSAEASLDEAQYLHLEARHAARAMGDCTLRIGHHLRQIGDPRIWLDCHPWWTLASAVIAGFTAAVVVIPSKEAEAVKARVEKTIRTEPEKRTSLFRSILTHALAIVKPAMLSIITALVQTYSAPPPPPDASSQDPTDPSVQPSG